MLKARKVVERLKVLWDRWRKPLPDDLCRFGPGGDYVRSKW